jgi:hypothetical protein
MRTRMRLTQRRRPLNRFRQRTWMRWSGIVISVLVVSLFSLTYLYLNLGTPKKAYALSTMTAVANGNWTSASTWSAGRVPQDGDTLTIPAGKTVTVDVVTASYNHLLIIVNGTLYFNGGKKIIMCEGMVVVAAGGLLNAANAGSKFEICGSFLWDGNDPGAGPLSFGGFTSTTLPVDLVYFRGTEENKKVNLQWETASQVNCDYFSIERSTDGVDFFPVVNIKGKGNSNERDAYNYIDADVFEGTLYYRLSEVDLDGTSQTFNTISVHIKPAPEVTIYPNPVAAGGSATVEIPVTDNNNAVEVSMMSIEGKRIFSKTFEKDNSRNSISFRTEALSDKGTFLLLVKESDTRTIKKIIVM